MRERKKEREKERKKEKERDRDWNIFNNLVILSRFLNPRKKKKLRNIIFYFMAGVKFGGDGVKILHLPPTDTFTNC